MAAGRLVGIARHARPRAPMETLDRVAVSTGEGIAGDGRGRARPGKVPKRQVSLIDLASWDQALAELGRAGDPALPWWVRRANLAISGLHLPRAGGFQLAIGERVRIGITGECDPCSRMDEIAPGLMAALTPDWRGGWVGQVLADGQIAIGDEIRIVE